MIRSITLPWNYGSHHLQGFVASGVINGCILNLSPFRIPSVNTISILFGRSFTNPLDARSLFPTPLVSDRGTGIDNTIVDRASVQYEKANAYCYCLPIHN
ncbi:hypothetical protein NQ318_016369 [Aromia moschata]|uniref:Uncharacterized protein n=1 Tax=Aromia moschata TaxID=1265417 RepID=A0AAV8Z564_9CUCU|nr:hypothetical protein NQ318_016369 [Aromia moschata]